MKNLMIKSIILVILVINGSYHPLFSQVIAGSISAGTAILYDVVNMSIIETDHDTTTWLDLDKDDIDDIRIWFLKGFPPADGPNYVVFYELNDAFSFCITSGVPGRTTLYEAGDTLCTTGHEWATDSLYIVECFGGWNCTGSSEPVNDKYVAYRKNDSGEIGWIKVSMDLYSGVAPDTITFQIEEMIVLDLETNIPNVDNQFDFALAPNPTPDGHFTIQCAEKLSSIEIYNTEGQLITSYKDNNQNLDLPEAKGLYIVKIRNEFGQEGSRRIVRL